MKKIAGILIILCLMLSLSACSCKEEASYQPENTAADSGKSAEADAGKNETDTAITDTNIEWTIYWYLCGSDLESNFGAATNDLAELLDVQLPENVKVVIQTGGTTFWQNDVISADVLGRYLYDNNGLQLIEELPSANMGDGQTLKDFLLFGKENYPAKRTAVVF